ncbi:MAG: 6,7-dimethyl-8-ribityllumazine synthase [Chlamydiales bacterium]|nr:6,7-dimethyl-8-ribityllumazine synthase [Chlamydiales bacterium]
MQGIEKDYKTVDLNTEGHSYGVVAARFNREITERLLEGALEGLKEFGVREEAMHISWVPGAFELPLVAKRLAESGRFDAVICLGAVIRGETPHFDYVAEGAAAGILKASLATDVPVIFSVLTTENWEQAESRAGRKEKNNGYNGALSAIEMVNLLKKL